LDWRQRFQVFTKINNYHIGITKPNLGIAIVLSVGALSMSVYQSWYNKSISLDWRLRFQVFTKINNYHMGITKPNLGIAIVLPVGALLMPV
jgi:hypothetical protein